MTNDRFKIYTGNYFLSVGRGHSISEWVSLLGEDLAVFHFENSSVFQSTGIHDSKGNEIFEGSILKEMVIDEVSGPNPFQVNHLVAWNKELGCWTSELGDRPLLGHWADNTEIVGDIMTNPNLYNFQ